jgi:murein DD-endopeptidase MepM/ murein hydrolase activator NlpD
VPPQIVQGGFAMVVLNEPATSATATFQGRQYPMLRSGQRSWALVGVGAFTEPQLYPVNVSYTPQAGAPSNLVVSLAVADKDYPVENIDLDPQTSALLSPDIVQAELARRAAIYSGYTAQRLWSGPFVRPHTGPLSSIYGEARSYNRGPVTDYHRGNDFVGDAGTPVSAAGAGRVAFTGELRVRGNSVMLDHGAGVFSAYHHLSRIDVADGQSVTAGQQLGALGATGLVTGPHLHWEVIVRGVEVDGQLWLDGREYGL